MITIDSVKQLLGEAINTTDAGLRRRAHSLIEGARHSDDFYLVLLQLATTMTEDPALRRLALSVVKNNAKALSQLPRAMATLQQLLPQLLQDPSPQVAKYAAVTAALAVVSAPHQWAEIFANIAPACLNPSVALLTFLSAVVEENDFSSIALVVPCCLQLKAYVATVLAQAQSVSHQVELQRLAALNQTTDGNGNAASVATAAAVDPTQVLLCAETRLVLEGEELALAVKLFTSVTAALGAEGQNCRRPDPNTGELFADTVATEQFSSFVAELCVVLAPLATAHAETARPTSMVSRLCAMTSILIDVPAAVADAVAFFSYVIHTSSQPLLPIVFLRQMLGAQYALSNLYRGEIFKNAFDAESLTNSAVASVSGNAQADANTCGQALAAAGPAFPLCLLPSSTFFSGHLGLGGRQLHRAGAAAAANAAVGLLNGGSFAVPAPEFGQDDVADADSTFLKLASARLDFMHALLESKVYAPIMRRAIEAPNGVDEAAAPLRGAATLYSCDGLKVAKATAAATGVGINPQFVPGSIVHQLDHVTSSVGSATAAEIVADSDTRVDSAFSAAFDAAFALSVHPDVIEKAVASDLSGASCPGFDVPVEGQVRRDASIVSRITGLTLKSAADGSAVSEASLDAARAHRIGYATAVCAPGVLQVLESLFPFVSVTMSKIEQWSTSPNSFLEEESGKADGVGFSIRDKALQTMKLAISTLSAPSALSQSQTPAQKQQQFIQQQHASVGALLTSTFSPVPNSNNAHSIGGGGSSGGGGISSSRSSSSSDAAVILSNFCALVLQSTAARSTDLVNALQASTAASAAAGGGGNADGVSAMSSIDQALCKAQLSILSVEREAALAVFETVLCGHKKLWSAITTQSTGVRSSGGGSAAASPSLAALGFFTTLATDASRVLSTGDAQMQAQASTSHPLIMSLQTIGAMAPPAAAASVYHQQRPFNQTQALFPPSVFETVVLGGIASFDLAQDLPPYLQSRALFVCRRALSKPDLCFASPHTVVQLLQFLLPRCISALSTSASFLLAVSACNVVAKAIKQGKKYARQNQMNVLRAQGGDQAAAAAVEANTALNFLTPDLVQSLLGGVSSFVARQLEGDALYLALETLLDLLPLVADSQIEPSLPSSVLKLWESNVTDPNVGELVVDILAKVLTKPSCEPAILSFLPWMQSVLDGSGDAFSLCIAPHIILITSNIVRRGSNAAALEAATALVSPLCNLLLHNDDSGVLGPAAECLACCFRRGKAEFAQLPVEGVAPAGGSGGSSRAAGLGHHPGSPSVAGVEALPMLDAVAAPQPLHAVLPTILMSMLSTERREPALFRVGPFIVEALNILAQLPPSASISAATTPGMMSPTLSSLHFDPLSAAAGSGGGVGGSGHRTRGRDRDDDETFSGARMMRGSRGRDTTPGAMSDASTVPQSVYLSVLSTLALRLTTIKTDILTEQLAYPLALALQSDPVSVYTTVLAPRARAVFQIWIPRMANFDSPLRVATMCDAFLLVLHNRQQFGENSFGCSLRRIAPKTQIPLGHALFVAACRGVVMLSKNVEHATDASTAASGGGHNNSTTAASAGGDGKKKSDGGISRKERQRDMLLLGGDDADFDDDAGDGDEWENDGDAMSLDDDDGDSDNGFGDDSDDDSDDEFDVDVAPGTASASLGQDGLEAEFTRPVSAAVYQGVVERLRPLVALYGAETQHVFSKAQREALRRIMAAAPPQ